MKGSITRLGQNIVLKNHKPVLVVPSITGRYVSTFCDPYIPMTPTQSKYKFSRAKWYQAEFDTQYYQEVEEWCAQHFGPHPKRPDAWSRWWHKFENSILFRDEKDYVLFCLRWS